MSKSVGAASTLIRGGQTTQHWWRMGWQVIRFATVVSALIYIAVFSALVLKDFNLRDMRIATYYEWAERGVLRQNGFNKTYTFIDVDGASKTLDAVTLYRDPAYRQIRDAFFLRFHMASRVSILPALLLGLVSLFIFARTGNKIQENEFVRGATLVTASELKVWSQAKWKAYNRKHKGRKRAKPLTISGIPFPPNAVEAQTCLYGTVGVGKSNAMREMLATIRENGGRGIIYDRMGTFVSEFYDEETDYIINPFDDRSHAWNPFDDVIDAASFIQMGEVMIPEHRGAASDPFWSQSARIVFSYAARELYKNPKTRTVRHLIDFVINLDASLLAQLISATPGRHFFNEEIEKTAQSIRANLIAELQFLEYLRNDAPPFSIRKWMSEDQPSFVFLTGDADHAAATRNIISAILDISATALMSEGQATEPRCYFFLDEVPTLNRMPFLIKSLAEIRQFGGAFVLGYQTYAQLEDVYGREAAQTIAGTTNNRIVFNIPDFRTAKLCSESLGNQDFWESNSNISVGAHEARDGVSFAQQRVERAIISPAEIQNLPQFRCAVKFAYDSPTALIDMTLFEVTNKNPSFLPYMGSAPGFGAVKPPEPKPDLRKDGPSDAEVLAAFSKWAAWHFPDVGGAEWSSMEDVPSKLRPYYAHFREAYAFGATPDHINPIVVVDDGLMANAPAAQKPASSAEPANGPKTADGDMPSDEDWAARFGHYAEASDPQPVTDQEIADLFSGDRSQPDEPSQSDADVGQSSLDRSSNSSEVSPPETCDPEQADLPFSDDWSPVSLRWDT